MDFMDSPSIYFSFSNLKSETLEKQEQEENL